MKRPFKVFQKNDCRPVLYKSDEEARTAEHNCDEAEDDCYDTCNEDALLKNYSSSSKPEIEYEEDGSPKSCTWVN